MSLYIEYARDVMEPLSAMLITKAVARCKNIHVHNSHTDHRSNCGCDMPVIATVDY